MRGERIEFHPLTVLRRGADRIIGYDAAGRHLSMGEEGYAVLHHLHRHSIADTERAYPELDVHAFVERLVDAGLVHRIDHRVMSPPVIAEDLAAFTPTAWRKHPVLDGTLLGLGALGIILTIINPPDFTWAFSAGWLALAVPIAFLSFFITTLAHESGHALALAQAGHRGRVSLVRKWYLILPQADLGAAGLLGEPQQRRVRRAGVAVELALLGALQLLLAFGVAPWLLRALALVVFLDVLVQLTPLPRTDLTDLLESRYGQGTVARSLRSLLPCRDCRKEASVPALPAVLVGFVLLGVALAVYALPAMLLYLHGSASGLLAAATARDTPLLVDSVLALLLAGITVSFYAVASVREHALSARGLFSWLAVLVFLLANYSVVFLLGTALLLYAQPAGITLALFLLGGLYGVLFSRLVEHIRLEESRGFARDLLLPVCAAATALLLLFMFAGFSAATGLAQPSALYAVAYATGMLTALIV